MPPAPRAIAQAQTKQGDARPTPRRQVSDPYRKWVNEDVAYIITDEERATFRSLDSDAEREHFIEQFWLRRDPTPGTVENEFKEEHYRRIAYSNENFYDDKLPGWKTDRGRVYITYGPPDEKESHPSATPPNELWRYRYIEGVGRDVIIEFIEQDGLMRMTRDPAARKGGEPQRLLGEAREMIPVLFMGKSGTLVTVTGRSVEIEVPTLVDSAERVYAKLQRGNQLVHTLEETVQGGRLSRRFPLAPGQYALEVVRKVPQGSFVSSDRVEFAVK
jgi:GWxTD domain-containing protein